MKSLTLTTLAWFILMLTVFVFSPPLYESFFIFFHLARWAMVMLGFLLLLWATIVFTKRKRGLICFILCTIGLAGYFTIGFDLGRHVLFQIRKPHYEKLLAEANQTGTVVKNQGFSDTTSPGKHAFFWQRGVVDNWAGVIHDPSGTLGKIKDPSRNGNLSLIFGGTYYDCQYMGEGWYICWFT